MASRVTDAGVAAPRSGRVSSAALLVAMLYSAALVAAGFLVPVYSSDSASSDDESAQGSATLVGVNGVGVVFVLAFPLLVSLLVAAVLRLLPDWGGSLPVAWGLTGLLAALNLLALLSIGVFFLPVTAALVLACATHRRPRSPA